MKDSQTLRGTLVRTVSLSAVSSRVSRSLIKKKRFF